MAGAAGTQAGQEEGPVGLGGENRTYGISPMAEATGLRRQAFLRMKLLVVARRRLARSPFSVPGEAERGAALLEENCDEPLNHPARRAALRTEARTSERNK